MSCKGFSLAVSVVGKVVTVGVGAGVTKQQFIIKECKIIIFKALKKEISIMIF